MAIFYIKTKAGEVYELTATTEVAFNYRSTNTRFPTEAGYAVTDHSTVENTTLSMGGVITNVVLLNKSSPTKGIKEYIEGLRALQLSATPFTVFMDDRLKPFTSCLFTEISGDKSQVEGLSGWRIKLGIEQIKIVNKAKASLLQVDESATAEASEATKDKTSETKDNGGKPTTRYSQFRGDEEKYLGGAISNGLGTGN